MDDVLENLEEKRTFERFSARFPVKYEHVRGDFGADVFMRDASAQGIRFTTTQRLFLHDSVSLVVELSDGFDPLVLKGRVVWTKTRAPNMWEIGMEFHKVNLMQIQRMYKLVSPDI